jgi:starch phosphorylase
VRDRLVDRWMKTTARQQYEQDVKRVYYLSMEFLIGRTFTNACWRSASSDEMKAALAELSAWTSHALPGYGAGRRARQRRPRPAGGLLPRFDGHARHSGLRLRHPLRIRHVPAADRRRPQVEAPDYWLARQSLGIPAPEVEYRCASAAASSSPANAWSGADRHQDLLAMAYDTVIPGHARKRPTRCGCGRPSAHGRIDLSAFNGGDYRGAVEKNLAENVTRVLYPDDSTPAGRELRLRQEYFFVSASLQDLIGRYLRTAQHFDAARARRHPPERYAPGAGDSRADAHPDRRTRPRLGRAWAITQQVFSYTNHTLMQEALETWPLDLFGAVLPRHLQIIFDINTRLLTDINTRFGPTST